MANRKITELAALTAPVADDLLTIVDISEGLNANKNKKISYGELFKSVVDGTAAAPSIAFDSSATTGIYRSGTNELSIATAGTQRLKIEASGATTIFGNLVVQGTQTTVSSSTLEVADKNIELAKGGGNDAAADGGGITLDSTDGDKLFKWLNSTDSWTSSEHLEIASGKTFRINGNNVLSQTTLGSTVVSSSLTSVGTLSGLAVSGDTTVTGKIDLSDNLDMPNNAKILLGNGDDLQIYHDGSSNWIDSANNHQMIIRAGTNNLYLQGNEVHLTNEGGSETYLKGVKDGAVDLFYNGVKKLETTSGGITVTGKIFADSFDMGDNERVLLGADDDLQIYHDGSNSSIVTSTGNLDLQSTADDVVVRCADDFIVLLANNESGIRSKSGGPTELYYDNNKKFETSNTGATLTGTLVVDNLDVGTDIDVDGTLEADAYTVNGTALNEYIADTVGAMVSSNTETNITVTYDDSDNTLDFVIGTLNQDTTGNAATATALETARTIGGVSFNGTANINLPGVNQTGNQNTTGSAATLTTARTIGGVSFDGSANISLPGVNAAGNQNTSGTAAGLSGTPTITVNEVVAASLDISGNADIDGTLEADAITVDGTALNEFIADTVGAMVSSNTETNITVTYEDSDNTLDFVIGTLNQDTTGSAATLTTARTIGGVSFDGSANIDLPGVNTAGNQNTSGTSAGLTGTPNITVGDVIAASLDISGNVDVDGTLETDALTINGTSLSETIADTVGAMVTSNTETGITVTYDDADNTLDFVVGTLNQNTTGNAATATALQNARTINGVSFDGTGNITVTAAAGTLTGATLASGVTASSLTSVGTLTGLTTSGNILMTGTGCIDVAAGTSAQRPGSPTAGMFRFNTTDGKFEGHDGSSWGEIGGSGGGGASFYINTLSSSSNTGGGSATFNGTAYRFTLSNAPATGNAAQMLVSVGGVIQKANSGTSQPSEGYAIDGNDIIFGAAPASAASWFIITYGALNAGTPTDNTVTTAKIVDNAVTGAKIADNLDIPDNNKIRFGTGNDLQVFHDGTDDVIHSTGTSLRTRSNIFRANNASNDAVLFRATAGGKFEAFYDGTKSFETTSNGTQFDGRIGFTGTGQKIDLIDNQELRIGTGDDLQIYHDGTDSFISNSNGTLKITSTAGNNIRLRSDNIRLQSITDTEDYLRAEKDGAVELYYDNSKKLETTSAGITLTGGGLTIPNGWNTQWGANASRAYIQGEDANGNNRLILGTNNAEKLRITSGGNVSIPNDSGKFTCGTGDDLEIYHSGSDSFIKDTGTGRLLLLGSEVDVLKSDGGEYMIQAVEDGAVSLYHDSVKKFETTSAGVQVTGTLRADGNVDLYDDQVVRCGDSADLQIYHDGTNSYIDHRSSSGELQLRLNAWPSMEKGIVLKPNGSVELYHNHSSKLETTVNGIWVSGAITGESLDIADNKKVLLGSGDDLQIYHDGSNSRIQNATGEMQNFADTWRVVSNSGSNENMIRATYNAGVELFYNNTKRAQTYADGLEVLGDFWINNQTNSGNDIWFDESANTFKFYDDVKGSFGTGNDLQIWHDGDSSYIIHNTSGTDFVIGADSPGDDLILRAADDVILRAGGDVTHGKVLNSGYTKFSNDFSSTGREADNYHLIHSHRTNSAALCVENSTDGNPYGILIDFSGASPDSNSVYFIKAEDGGNTNRFTVWSDGDIDNHDNSYSGFSDVKLKENIVDAESQWNDVKAIKVRNFNFKTDTASDKRLGVVAQEIETVCPKLVVDRKDIDDNFEETGTTTKSVKYSILYMKAFKALQEAMAKIETLEAKVAALESA